MPHTSVAVRLVIIGAVVVGLRCPVAFAQWDPAFTANLGQGYGAIALSQSILSGTRRLGEPNTSPSQRAPLPKEILTFSSDPRVSDRVRGSVMETLGQHNPALRPQMAQAFAGNSVLKLFDRFMSSQGYSSHNVAEAATVWLLVNWEIATGNVVTPAQREGALEQVRGIFLNTPELRALTDAERQELAERMAYQVVISSMARRQYLRNGDRPHLQQLQQTAATTLSRQGVDIGRLRLTDRGFTTGF